MYVKLNDRTYLNKDKITRIKIDSAFKTAFVSVFMRVQTKLLRAKDLRVKQKLTSG